jgi:hypothetical protein
VLLTFECFTFFVVSEETCNEVESLVFDLFANLGATGLITSLLRYVLRDSDERTIGFSISHYLQKARTNNFYSLLPLVGP